MSHLSSKVRTILCGLVVLVLAASLRVQDLGAEQSEATSGTQQNDLSAGNFFQRLGSFYNHDWHGTIAEPAGSAWSSLSQTTIASTALTPHAVKSNMYPGCTR
jgi:hypothetical protein